MLSESKTQEAKMIERCIEKPLRSFKECAYNSDERNTTVYAPIVKAAVTLWKSVVFFTTLL